MNAIDQVNATADNHSPYQPRRIAHEKNWDNRGLVPPLLQNDNAHDNEIEFIAPALDPLSERQSGQLWGQERHPLPATSITTRQSMATARDSVDADKAGCRFIIADMRSLS